MSMSSTDCKNVRIALSQRALPTFGTALMILWGRMDRKQRAFYLPWPLLEPKSGDREMWWLWYLASYFRWASLGLQIFHFLIRDQMYKITIRTHFINIPISKWWELVLTWMLGKAWRPVVLSLIAYLLYFLYKKAIIRTIHCKALLL